MKDYKEVFNINYKMDNKYVRLKDMIFNKKVKDITVPLGIEKENNHNRYIDFSDVSCLLVGGETGSGKSVFLDSIITTLLLNNKDIEFIMMDPKKIELSYYKEITDIVKKVISDNKECFEELKIINNEYIKRKKELKNFNNIYEYNKENKNKIKQLFIVIDESCKLMEIKESEELLYNMINDSCNYGIHFIIASNSIWEKYFSTEFINSIKYIITFDLAEKEDAKMLGNVKAKNLSVPGNAIIIDDIKYQDFQLQTPYISDLEINNAIEYCKKR